MQLYCTTLVTKLQTGRPLDGSSTPSEGKKFHSPPKYPD
jgi:hypothetical protein